MQMTVIIFRIRKENMCTEKIRESMRGRFIHEPLKFFQHYATIRVHNVVEKLGAFSKDFGTRVLNRRILGANLPLSLEKLYTCGQ